MSGPSNLSCLTRFFTYMNSHGWFDFTNFHLFDRRLVNTTSLQAEYPVVQSFSTVILWQCNWPIHVYNHECIRSWCTVEQLLFMFRSVNFGKFVGFAKISCTRIFPLEHNKHYLYTKRLGYLRFIGTGQGQKPGSATRLYPLSRTLSLDKYFLRMYSNKIHTLGHGQLIPWMADRPMQWKYPR